MQRRVGIWHRALGDLFPGHAALLLGGLPGRHGGGAQGEHSAQAQIRQ